MVYLYAGGILPVYNAHKQRGVLANLGIFRVAHDTLLVQAVQAIGYDTDIIIVQTRDTV